MLKEISIFSLNLIGRSILIIHSILITHQVIQLTNASKYIIISLVFSLLIFFDLIRSIYNPKLESRWYSRSILFYIFNLIPLIWVIEIEKNRLKKSKIDENVHTINTLHLWLQSFYGLVVLARILIPKRNCSLEHLSNLGLILVGTASDLQEFQSQIDDLYEIHIDKYWMEYVYFIFLGIWTWSLFILVVNLDRSDPSPSHVASHPIDKFVQNLHFKIFVNLFFNDIPYFSIRFFLIYFIKFIDYNSYFFLAKNLIAILVGIVHLFRSTVNKYD